MAETALTDELTCSTAFAASETLRVMSNARIAVILAVAGCGSGGGGGDAPTGDRDAAAPDATACVLPEPPETCDPDAMPLPNPACLATEPGTGGCPDGMVRVDAFCIDRYEVTIDGHSPYWNPGA